MAEGGLTFDAGKYQHLSGGKSMMQRLVEASERTAAANEALIELATKERLISEEHEPGPAFCPHCGTFNPSIRNEGAAGSMGDFVLIAGCQDCGQTFFGIPEGWIVLKTKQEAREALEHKEAENGST